MKIAMSQFTRTLIETENLFYYCCFSFLEKSFIFSIIEHKLKLKLNRGSADFFNMSDERTRKGSVLVRVGTIWFDH